MEDDIDTFYTDMRSRFSSGEVRELRGHKQKVLTVGWSCDGTKLASGSVDQSTRVYTNVKHGVNDCEKRRKALRVCSYAAIHPILDSR